MFQKSSLYLLLIVFFLIQSFDANASHIMGGEITWKCQPNGKYEFTLKVYRDCNGIALGTTNINVYANNYPTLGGKTAIPMSFISLTDISPACLGSPCRSGRLNPAIPGTIQEYVFRSADVKLIGIPPAAGWIFTWADGNRNSAINNIKNAQNFGITLRAKMYPFQGRNAFPCFDSSPDFFQKPSSINCAGEKFVYNHNAYDNELDSLSYSWANPLDQLGTGAKFKTGVTPNILQYDIANGYAYNSPFPNSSQDSRNVPATLDKNNGEISLTSFTGGQYVSVVNVKAYRCGFLVAEVYRELQTVLLVGCAANQPPEIPPPFSNGTFSDTVKAGDFVDINFSVYDTIRPDNPGNDSIFIQATGQQFGNNYSDSTSGCKYPPCATLSHPLPDTAVGSYTSRFKWQTSCNHIADFVPDCITTKNTYLFVIKAFDNACPGTGTTMATFSITVVADSLMEHPEIYCADVQNDGSVILNWQKTDDPDISFHQWMIYSANDKNGPYQLIDSVLTYGTTTYTDINANANDQSMSYLVRAKSGCNSNWMVNPPDTISTIFVNATFNDTCVFVSWNPLKDNLPTGSNTHYKIYREYPIGSGFVFYKNLSTNFTSFCDTFNVCIDTIAYKIELENTTMGCSSNSNSKGIRFKYPIPQADAGSDYDICVGQSVQLGATPLYPNDTFIWSPSVSIDDTSLVRPTVNPIDTTKYYLLEINRRGCTSLDSVWVNVRPTPIANAGVSDTLICSQNLPFQLNGTVSVSDSGRWIGGSGTFSPNRNTLNATYMPSQTEINTDSVNLWLVSADNGICDPDTDKIVIHIAQFKSNLQLNVNMINCYRSKDGTAKIIANGSNAPYTFSWQTPSGTLSGDSISKLDTGKYSVTITNVYGCDSTMNFDITEPAVLTVNAKTLNNVSCNGLNDAKAYADVGGGSIPYRYSWSTNQKTDTIRNIGTGNYIITITDTNNCTAIDSIKITSPDSLITTIDTAINISCFGAADGSITTSTKGGTTPYTYSWSNSATTASVSALSPGTYIISITDANGCSTVDSIKITQPNALTISNISKRDISCFGFTDGYAAVKANGGTLPYTYLWSNSKTTDSISMLTSGMYYVTITDKNLCNVIDSVKITSPDSLITTIDTAINISCFGEADGSINTSTIGGTTPYTYSWSNSTTTNNLSGLSPGVYIITITDKNLCNVIDSVKITSPDSLITTIDTAINISCFGAADGSITTSTKGGTTPYTYSWSNSATTASVSALSPGTYIISITDANGCSTIDSINISQPNALTISNISKRDISCLGFTDGYAAVKVNGGTLPYTYLWSNNKTTDSISKLTSGMYYVTITDKNLCNVIDSVKINQFPAIKVTSSGKPISCYGRTDGEAEVSVNGGTSPYQFHWNNNINQSKIIALNKGTYSVTITDNNGCKDTSTYTVTEPDSISLTVSPSTDTVCINVPIKIQAFAQGGTGGYTYNWSHKLGSNPIQNVSIKKDELYTVSVTDSNNCPLKTKTIKLTVKDLFSDNLSITATPSAICIGDSSTIKTSFNGKFGPYNYSWNQFLGGIENHKVGPINNTLYILSVTDNCNNSVSDSVLLNVSPLPEIHLPDTLIEGCEDLMVHFSNHTSPSFIYSWNFGDGKKSTDAEPIHLYTKPGVYQVKVNVKSNKGCKSNSATNHRVKVNPSPVAEIFANPTTTNMENPKVNFYGDFSDATSWNWNLGEGTDTNTVNHFNIIYPDSGTYRVRLIENNNFGCADTAYITIIINPSFVIKIPNAFTPNTNGANGGRYNSNDYSNEVFHPFLENVEKYHLLIFNRWGETIFQSNDVDVGWDGYYKGKLSQSDVYIYKLQVTFINGKKVTKVGDITLLR